MTIQAHDDDDLDAKRARVQAALQADKRNTERRVYVLPRSLVGRVLDYQLEKLLPSEVAAVRDLLERGLEAKGFAMSVEARQDHTPARRPA